jgi:hypothetical protein
MKRVYRNGNNSQAARHAEKVKANPCRLGNALQYPPHAFPHGSEGCYAYCWQRAAGCKSVAASTNETAGCSGKSAATIAVTVAMLLFACRVTMGTG